MTILGIETSCDETAAAICQNRKILSNTVSQQIVHVEFGGVVPEIASREHEILLNTIVHHTLGESNIHLRELDAISVTQGPGLAGTLLTGISFAKGLGIGLNIPVIPVNHLEGHIFANFLSDPTLDYPFVCLLVSGGHTQLWNIKGMEQYELLGETRDDAAGEAFDKGARLLGLGFPGGPAIQNTAQYATEAEKFPRAWLGESFDFSFSGLKTSLLHRTQQLPDNSFDYSGRMKTSVVASQAAAYQEAITDVLSEKAVRAAKKYKAKGILIGGGVAANSRLRELIDQRSPMPTLIPRNSLCTDNGAMIAAAALYHVKLGSTSSFDIDVNPNMSLA